MLVIEDVAGGRQQNPWSEVLGDAATGDAQTTDPDLSVSEPSDTQVTLPAGPVPLRLPTHDDPPTLPTDPAAPAVPSVPVPLSETTLLSDLDGTGPTLPAAPGAEAGRSEYRELILTVAIGLAVLVAAVIWGRNLWRPEAEPPAPKAAAPAPEPGPRSGPIDRPTKPTPTPRAPAGSTPPPTDDVQKAAIPMLSIVTRPSGALVEIDGVVYSRTPLIAEAPRGRTSLSIELRLDDHKPWSGIIEPNEAGHFNLNVMLEPF